MGYWSNAGTRRAQPRAAASGSSSPIEDLQEIAQGVDSIEISDDSEEFLNVKANPGLNPNSARKEIHITEGAEETELERILKKNEYYKRLKKNRENLDKPDGPTKRMDPIANALDVVQIRTK